MTRIFLRPIEEQDYPGIQRGCQHAETLYMTGTRKTFTLEEIRSAYTRFLQDDSRRDFAICLLDTKEMIGDAAIVDIDPTIIRQASALRFTGRSIFKRAMALKRFGWFKHLPLTH
ncbi:hypothetical protein BsIDN1_09860 [Bacillus safensis]|uniref:N-acetyltransferase domain-containing protein n=1 Tax=Bacillus safensis TaxID=561879 RepID=A0A5S9M3R3_BACIA|nr:hypothetical protein BsIDN1_09860 [Bacillus safensis]